LGDIFEGEQGSAMKHDDGALAMQDEKNKKM
jgi:hypothetical protein